MNMFFNAQWDGTVLAVDESYSHICLQHYHFARRVCSNGYQNYTSCSAMLKTVSINETKCCIFSYTGSYSLYSDNAMELVRRKFVVELAGVNLGLEAESYGHILVYKYILVFGAKKWTLP